MLDDLSTGRRTNLDPSVRLYQHDIRDPAVRSVFEDFRPEVVDHHAAQANVPSSVADPVNDASINVLGGLNLLKLSAASSGCASSSTSRPAAPCTATPTVCPWTRPRRHGRSPRTAPASRPSRPGWASTSAPSASTTQPCATGTSTARARACARKGRWSPSSPRAWPPASRSRSTAPASKRAISSTLATASPPTWRRWSGVRACRSISAPAGQRRFARSSTCLPRSPATTDHRSSARRARATWCTSCSTSSRARTAARLGSSHPAGRRPGRDLRLLPCRPRLRRAPMS